MTETVPVGAVSLNITVGFYPDGRPGEVFIDGFRGIKAGSMMALIVNDMAVLISLLLQQGLTPSEISHSMGCEDVSIAKAATDVLQRYWPRSTGGTPQ